MIKCVCYSDNTLHDLLISSRLNDLTTCYRRFNVDIMMLYISVRDHARKLKFSCYIHLPSIKNVSISLCLSDSVRCKRGYYFQARVLYFSSGTH